GHSLNSVNSRNSQIFPFFPHFRLPGVAAAAPFAAGRVLPPPPAAPGGSGTPRFPKFPFPEFPEFPEFPFFPPTDPPESLQRRRALLAAFCRLLLRGALPLRAATDLFKHYAKFSGDFGDILRETLRETRQRDGAEWARTLLLSLQQLFTELLLQEGPALRRLPEFQEIRDLGRRLSLFFSLRHLRHRRPLLQLHSEGITFSLLPPPRLGAVPGIPAGFPLNLPFLEVLSEFSARLQRPDRAHLLSLLERRWRELGLGPDFGADLGDFGADLGDFGAPLLCYRRSLSAAPGPARARRAPRSNERQQRAPSSSPWPPTPTLTSTALRGGPQKRRPSPTLPSSESKRSWESR
uniref:Uncharacterized protein n=1 Tax=Taeniopygia guttata TaxID=59729 RepID=A0A674GRW2_TAEGU